MSTSEKCPMSSTIRVRENRWKEVEKLAWKLSMENKKIIKPTDVADAIFWKYTKEITLEDIENAKKNR